MSATKMSGQARDSNVGSAAQAVRYSYMCQLCLSKRSASTIKQGTKKAVRRTVRSFQPAFSAHKQFNFQEDRHRISDIAVGPGPIFFAALAVGGSTSDPLGAPALPPAP